MKDIRYVYNDVYKDPYETDELVVSLGALDFYFSTGKNKERFERRLKTNIEKIRYWTGVYVGENFMLENVINFFYTYRVTETRGYRVELRSENEVEVLRCHKEATEMLNSIYSSVLD